jgi:hypothetical protein
MTLNPAADLQTSQQHWLRQYYLVRAAFSLLWVAAILTIGQQIPALGAALLVLYPAWDAAANYLDAERNGGLRANRTQALNTLLSVLAAIGIAIGLGISPNLVLTIFGAWAIVAGLLQLATGLRRWRKAGAQWAMILSGAQSALAGAAFMVQAQQGTPAVGQTVAGYAAFGAVYFLVSAIWLFIRKPRTAS